MKEFFNLLGREFRLFWNNNVLRLLFIGASIFYAVLLGYVYEKGKGTDLPIIVVDEDRSTMSRKIIEILEDNEVVHVALGKFDETNLSRETIDLEANSII